MLRRAVANRLGLASVGLVLLAAGGYVLARRFDVVVPGSRHGRVYPADLARRLHQHDWIWWAVGGGAIVIGLLAIFWLRLVVRSQHLPTIVPDADARGGRTTLPADVLADAVEEDVAGLPGVHRVAVVVDGAPTAPRLEVRVVAYGGTDVTALREQIATDVVDAARTALGDVPLPVLVITRVVRRRAGAVHVD